MHADSIMRFCAFSGHVQPASSWCRPSVAVSDYPFMYICSVISTNNSRKDASFDAHCLCISISLSLSRSRPITIRRWLQILIKLFIDDFTVPATATGQHRHWYRLRALSITVNSVFWGSEGKRDGRAVAKKLALWTHDALYWWWWGWLL